MKTESYDNFNTNDTEYIVYYSGETDKQKKYIYEFCKILTSLWNDYQIDNDDNTKIVFFKSFFLDEPSEEYRFCRKNNQTIITTNNTKYFSNISDNIYIYIDYKEQKNPIIENIFDVIESSVCIQNNKSEYIDFVSNDNKKIQFMFNSLGITIINNMDIDVNFNINIIPLLEEFTFTIPAYTKQFGKMCEKYCVISQIKI